LEKNNVLFRPRRVSICEGLKGSWNTVSLHSNLEPPSLSLCPEGFRGSRPFWLLFGAMPKSDKKNNHLSSAQSFASSLNKEENNCLLR